MGRAPRADEAGGIYHALNRGNGRHDIFLKEADFEAFEHLIKSKLRVPGSREFDKGGGIKKLLSFSLLPKPKRAAAPSPSKGR